MTVPERLNARPAAIRLSRLRAPARNGEVRANAQNHPHNIPPKLQNADAFGQAAGDRAAQTVAHCPCKLQTGQLPAIEIP
jgi:hypothetical protein